MTARGMGLGSMEMSRPVSASGDEGRCLTGRGPLLCEEKGAEGEAPGGQGSTAAIINLTSWQCPVNQRAHISKHQKQSLNCDPGLVWSHV